ncbi:hypothetical protein [Collimonas arenae]|uniref:hypothetical protein n=1 Tax=Collimonas arenae TaxID=279058 RepID=UPI0012E0907A|nr:hypothetical protein [Collimonas arenae]
MRLRDVTPDDICKNWLWQYVPSKDGELWVKPIHVKKTDKFSQRLAGCQVTLADGSSMWALIEGINVETPEFSKHNKELIIAIDNYGWFRLAQYFDSRELKEIRGPEILCDLLGKKIDEVFPVEFDLRDRAKVDSSCLRGKFEVDPVWGMAQSDVMMILVRELANGGNS